MQINQYLSLFSYPSIVKKSPLEQAAAYAADVAHLKQETCFLSATFILVLSLRVVLWSQHIWIIVLRDPLLGPDYGEVMKRLV